MAADSLLAAGEYAAAREAYGEVFAAWPDSISVAYRLAQTHVVTGRPRESLALFRQAVAAGYRKTSALYYMAIAQGDMGDMAAAYATLDTMMAAGFRNKYGLLTDSMLVTLRSDERWPVAPLEDADEVVTGSDLAIWNRWVERDRPEDWASASFLDALVVEPEGEDVPAVLHVSGWWDVESIATQRNWSRLAAAGKRDQWLLYGPWQHDNFYEHPPLARGDLEFGEAARIAYLAEWTRFFDHWLKHRPVGLDTLPRVRAFVIGENRWAGGDAWPLPDAVERVLHLGTNAGRPGEAGSLTAVAPPSTPAASFRTDPSDILLHDDPTFAEDTRYHAGAVNRADQLAWISEPLSEGVSVVGPAELEISVATDAPDVDLYALLVSVDPDGTARALAQPGKMRASLAAGERLRSATPVRLTVPMFPLGYDLPAGSRLGLVLRADWFPRFAPVAGDGGAPQVVRATIGGGTTTAPRLSFYVLPED